MTATRRRFDWRTIHADLDLRLARLGATYANDQARVALLLRQRSVQLAKPHDGADSAAELMRLMLFEAGGERFGLAPEWAQEACPMPRLARLPGASAEVAGIVEWRGEFVLVFDAVSLFGLGAAHEPARNIIVLRGRAPRVALAVAAVDSLIRIDPAQLQSSSQLQLSRGDLFRGITPDAVRVLDGDRLLARLAQVARAA